MFGASSRLVHFRWGRKLTSSRSAACCAGDSEERLRPSRQTGGISPCSGVLRDSDMYYRLNGVTQRLTGAPAAAYNPQVSPGHPVTRLEPEGELLLTTNKRCRLRSLRRADRNKVSAPVA